MKKLLLFGALAFGSNLVAQTSSGAVTDVDGNNHTQGSPTYKVGDIVPELGGIVFYIDSSGKHGLVAAEVDQGAYPWGCTDIVIDGSDSEVVFGGKKNTKDIVEGCKHEEISAKICNSLLLNDFDDWYLPSKDELNLMHVNLYKQGLGNFKNTWYHSSTQRKQKSYFSMNDVWHQKFDKEGSQMPAGKKVPAQVRAIRCF
jgi:hypothetical protein